MPRSTNDTSALRNDLERYAEIAGVNFNCKMVDQVLTVFGDVYADPKSWVGVRTTTEPTGKRDVNFRYLNRSTEHDVVERLRENGMVNFRGHPVEDLHSDIIARYSVHWGADFTVSHGCQKIWALLPESVPVEDILGLPHLPEAARKHHSHFTRYWMDKVSLIALDFWNQSVNLYSGLLRPNQLTKYDVKELIESLSFAVPSDEELLRDTEALAAYYTFSWDYPGVCRLCFL
ncbi:aromatic prenyltransferase [Actinomadura sp. 9N215]|uniref:aromatic prenyltransferase n=1 Tax=Actinomadura sp. 9N215 TaxID=3375150 RepID=UPI0037A5094D